MATATMTRAAELAKSKVGYREGPRNNETMFGAWFGQNFVAWCAIFLSWVSAHSGVTYLGKPWRFASTVAARDHAKKNRRWTTTPTVGTFAMMAHSATTGHIGFVIALLRRNGKLIVVTVEGNTNDQGAREGNGVWLRERAASSWDGYIVLDQTFEEVTPPSDNDEEPEDEMKLHLYRIRDENDTNKQHPVLGHGIWVSDGLTTNIMSEAQFVHGKNLNWYDASTIELIPETLHNALVETSRIGNLGGSSVVAVLEAIKAELDNPESDGGSGQITSETIDEIAKRVLDAQHERLSS